MIKKRAIVLLLGLSFIGCKKNKTPIQILASHAWQVYSFYSPGWGITNSGCLVQEYFTFTTNGTGSEVHVCGDTQFSFHYSLTADDKTMYMHYDLNGGLDTVTIKTLTENNLDFTYTDGIDYSFIPR